MMKAGAELGFSCGVGFHPSPIVSTITSPYQSQKNLCSEVKCPVLLLPADNDPPNLKENGALIKFLPEGSSTHTYSTMSHGYMSRGLAIPDAFADATFKGTPEEIAAVQTDALKRTVDFMKAAIERPPVAQLVIQARL